MSVPLPRRTVLAGLGAAALGAVTGCGSSDRRTVSLYNWDSYIAPATLRAFEAATGIGVVQSTYANDDELVAKLAGGSSDYDVVVPSHLALAKMIALGLVRPLDTTRLPNLVNLLPDWRDPAYDPGGRHSVPYSWQVTGIGFARAALHPAGAAPASWRDVLASAAYAGRIALPGASTELLDLAARSLGPPPGQPSPGQPSQGPQLSAANVDAAAAVLIAQKPAVLFHADDGAAMLLARTADLVVTDNAAVAAAALSDPDLGFTVPREGGQLTADTLAIPRAARDPNAAHALIDHLLRADAGAALARLTGYPTANAAARALMPPRYRDNEILFPGGPGMAASRFTATPDAALQLRIDRALTRFRAAPPVSRQS